jgi:exopolysaccharide biosynthesis polyprenyl glycosylphosphotransferase
MASSATASRENVLELPSSGKPSRALTRGRTTMLAAGDLVALVVAYAATYVTSEQIGPLPAVSAPGWFLAFIAVTAAPVWLAVFTAYHLYDNDNQRIAVASFDEVRDIFHAILAGSLAFLILSQGLRYLFGWWIYSAVEAFIFLGTALILVPVIRGSLRSWVLPRVMRRRRTLIVGSGREAQLVHRKLMAHPEYGLDVVGFLDGNGEAPDDSIGPVLGSREDIAGIIDEHEIDRVLLGSSIASHEEMLDLIRTVRRPDVQVSIVPNYFEIFTSRAILDEVEGMSVVTLPPMNLGRSSRLLKRSFDVVVSSSALLLLSPILAAIAISIRLDSKGSALYRQPRRGRYGSTFHIVKFRTMRVGAEKDRSEVLHMNEVDGPLFKIKGRDPRVTRVGSFLRRTSLDELPQLWNVVKGEMSLVGPRPFVVYEADMITGWAQRRLDMTPGITGLWQVLGRNDIPFEEMTKLDYLYVTNWSVWWDLKILCQTIPVVLGKRGAY